MRRVCGETAKIEYFAVRARVSSLDILMLIVDMLLTVPKAKLINENHLDSQSVINCLSINIDYIRLFLG